jgi:NhaP-type Na+/H+ or K+/H+ antiporter
MDLTKPRDVLLLLGALIVLSSWLRILLRKVPLSTPMVAVAVGYAAFSTHFLQVDLNHFVSSNAAELLSEIVLLIAIMAAGLKLDRRPGLRAWGSTWRLLGIAMPLTIAFMTVVCGLLDAYAWPTALLIAAALAPTDPVLASEVEVKPPGEGEASETRFALTSEAGLNDGLAFPFVSLAILLAAGAGLNGPWLAQHFLFETLSAVAIGMVLGRVFGSLMFRLPGGLPIAATGDGLVALAVAFLTYGVADLLGAHGFVAVFVSAVSLRWSCPGSDFHRSMTDFSGQIEQFVSTLLLVAFGGALASGLLAPLRWTDALVAAGLIFAIRPLASLVSLVGSPHAWPTRAGIAFFGVRGIAAFFYLIYALPKGRFDDEARIWALIGVTVLASIVVHGLTAGPAMKRLEQSENCAP